MTEWEKYSLITGYIVLIAALTALFVFDVQYPVLAVPAIVGVALITYALYQYMNCRGCPDERMMKIITYSMANSWLTTLVFAITHILMELFGLLPRYTVMRTLCMTLFMMLLFFGAWYLYFQRKGDVA